MPDSALVAKISEAFTRTAEGVRAGGEVEWADAIEDAHALWEESYDDAETDYEVVLAALDATILTEAAGPDGPNLAMQWRQVARQHGPDPDVFPEPGLAELYAARVPPYRFARSLALLFLDVTNTDRKDPRARKILDVAAASVMISDAAQDGNIPTSIAHLLEVLRTADDVLHGVPGVQKTRSRIEYIRAALAGSVKPRHQQTQRWTDHVAGAVALTTQIMQTMEAVFRNTAWRPR